MTGIETRLWPVLVLVASLFLCPSLWAMDIRGVNVTSFGYDGYDSPMARATIDWAQCVGATDIALVTENDVDPQTDQVGNPRHLTGPNHRLVLLANYAKSLGLHVTIKPHYINRESGDNLQYPPYYPKSMDRFFDEYRASILAHAVAAAAAGADRLVIGTEMGGQITGAENHERWREIIRTIRSVFPGKLTYAAAVSAKWPDSRSANEAAFVSFWSLLDEAGLNLYPSLTSDETATLPVAEALFYKNREGSNIVEHVRSLAEHAGLPVLITETGFRSKRGALSDHGDWNTSGAPDEDLQATALTAELDVLEREGHGWLEGVLLWILPIDGQPTATGFDFRGKAAEGLVGRWLRGGSVVAEEAGAVRSANPACPLARLSAR